jgi:hypothetical protein
MQDGQQPTEPGWVFKPGDQAPSSPSTTPKEPATEPAVSSPQVTQKQAPPVEASATVHVEWTASEYLANPKGVGWFGILAVGSVLLAAIVYFVTKDMISAVVVAILGIIVGVFAARQPKTLHYKIDSDGIHIGNKLYPYGGFKAFSVAREHAIGFIALLPLKRFMPPLIVHYDDKDEETIADTLSAYLPFEEHKPDFVDTITRKVRF